ncbi:hypothetical protein [Hoeflea sp.]|uniref:hypothetical protein n=1 Tax=Hoeflea sp. TaxID=1940281 RepID=UPI003A93F71D
MSEEESPQNADYERLLAHRVFLAELAKHNISLFDKAVLTLSSSALGLSLLFTDKLGGLASIKYPPVLGAAWGLYILAILANLWSYRAGWQDAVHQIDIVDRCLAGQLEASFKSSPLREWTCHLNTAAFGFFSAATICVCMFAYLNLIGPNNDEASPTSPTTATQSATTGS